MKKMSVDGYKTSKDFPHWYGIMTGSKKITIENLPCYDPEEIGKVLNAQVKSVWTDEMGRLFLDIY